MGIFLPKTCPTSRPSDPRTKGMGEKLDKRIHLIRAVLEGYREVVPSCQVSGSVDAGRATPTLSLRPSFLGGGAAGEPVRSISPSAAAH